MIPFTKARYYFSDKGLQEKTSELVIDVRELRKALNVHFFEEGTLTKRSGYIKRFSNELTGSPIITGLYELIQRDGTKKFLVCADQLYTSIDGLISASLVSGGLSFTVGSEGQNFNSMITFNNKTLGTNGIENIWQYNGTTAQVLAGSPPIAPIIATYQNFVFLAGNSTYPYRLYFSNDGDETTWTATDYIDIGDLTAGITGLVVLFGKLYIFTRKAMYELRGYDRDTFIKEEVTLSTGCVAYKSVVKIDNNVVFWSDRGPYSFDGINVHYLGKNIGTTISGLNYNRIGQIVGELYKAKNQVWWSVSTGSNTNHNQVICMTYDPTAAEGAGIGQANVGFAIYTGMAFNAFGLETSVSSPDRLFAGGYAGLVFKQDFGNSDNGAGIDFSVKTPPIDMGQPEEFKRFRYMWIFNKQQGSYDLAISYVTDFGLGGTTTTLALSVAGSASLWGTMVWGVDIWGGNTVIKSRIGLKANGHHLEIIFSNTGANQPVAIKGFTILAQVKGSGRL